MKYAIILSFTVLIFGCQPEKKEIPATSEPIVVTDTILEPHVVPENPAVYANQRFRNVTVAEIGENKFQLQGEAQIFEANFGWVIEDGHNELQSGNQMTDAGAPDWGKFNFVVDAKKDRENSTLHLILFESSAKDGSRQHQLMIPLK